MIFMLQNDEVLSHYFSKSEKGTNDSIVENHIEQF